MGREEYHAVGMSSVPRRPPAILPALLALLALFYLIGVSPWGLCERDEGRYANVAQEMLDRGDPITPRVNGAVFLDKPPLVYWVTAASLALWGHGERGARFGQLLFAAGTLLVVWRLGLRLLDRRRALIASIVLASSVGFFAAAHVLTLDLGLTFFVSLTLLLFLEGYRRGRPGGGRWYLGMAAAAAGGVLTKGPVGVVLPAMTIAAFLTLRREWGRVREMRPVAGSLVFLAVAAPWYVAVSLRNPEFPAYFFLHEHLARFFTTVHHRQGPWYYYLGIATIGLMPWSLLLPAHLLRRARGPAVWRDAARREAPAFIGSWILTGLVFFSLAQSKLPPYILPLFPAAALAIAALLDRDLREYGVPRRALAWGSLALPLAGVGAAILWIRHAPAQFGAGFGEALPLLASVPILAAAALLAGYLLARRGRVVAAITTLGFLWMIACHAVLSVVGRVNFLNETRHFAAVLSLEREGDERVYAYRCFLRGLPFYLRQPVAVVSYNSDELAIGREYGHDAASFLDEGRFLKRLRHDERLFAVIRHGDLPDLQRTAGRPLFLLAQSRYHDLITNRLGLLRQRQIAAVIAATPIDFGAALRRAADLVPGGTIEMIELERESGEMQYTVMLYRAGSHVEVHFPLARPDDVTVVAEDQSREESGEEDHLVRIVPSPGTAEGFPLSILDPSPDAAAGAG
jgi:4-amino-4-deoxy-L-arabinose transferase-like glycosyltransferase